MLKKKISTSLVAVVVSLLAAVLLMGSFVVTQYTESTFTYVFYNDTAPADKPNNNSGDVLDASFSTSILSAAPAEVRADPAGNKEWFKEDLFNRLYNHAENSGDPALLAQLLLDAMLRAPKTVTEKLLPYEEQSTEMWTETILRFVDNQGDHITSAGQLQAVLNRAQSYEVREITGGYTSSGYMKRDGIVLNSEYAEKLGRNAVPLPMLEDSQGTKGFEIVFHFSNGETLSYRINCGYQPDASSYPSGGKTPTYKPPNIDIDISTPDPSKPTPPPGGEDPDPSRPPKPDPKDPDGGPQGQNPDNPDYGGGPNTDNDETPTSEPSSPSTYTPPDRPTPAPDSSSSSPPPASSGGNETIPVDTDGDGKPDDSFTGEVVTGPQPETPLDDVHADPPPVESGLDDGQNSGEVGPPR